MDRTGRGSRFRRSTSNNMALRSRREMTGIKSFQAKIDQLMRINRAILAFLVIVLLGIGIVVWRIFTATLTKNPDYDEDKAQRHQQQKQLIVSCYGNCPYGNSNEPTNF